MAENSNLLSWILFFPGLTAVALLLGNVAVRAVGIGEISDSVWKGVALGSSLITFVLSLLLWVGFDSSSGEFQFIQYVTWLPSIGAHYFVGIDGISLLLVALTTFLMPIVLLSSWREIRHSVKNYIFFMLCLETGMLGAFVSLNLFQFYLFWELMLVPMYFIIGIWGGGRRIYAAVKFFLFTMFGSLLMLVAILVLYYLNFDQQGEGARLVLDFVAPPGSEILTLRDTVVPLSGQAVWWKTQPWLFAAFALAFGIKVPIVPFHTWLPDAHVEAPTAGSVILAGVLLKMGTYGFVRFSLPLFPDASVVFAPVIFSLGIAGVLYGALVAMVQKDIKRLVAYSSVAHLGFVMIGMFALNVEGLEGSILQMVNHGLSTGALFLLVGILYERRHTHLIADFGGIAKPMPVFAALFGIVVMSSIGLPGLNGFVGEFLILLGVFKTSPGTAVAAALGVVLSAVYLLWAFRRVVFGPIENGENSRLIDLGLREKVVMIAILVPIFWIGLYPEPFLQRLRPSVLELLRVMGDKQHAITLHQNYGEPLVELTALDSEVLR